MVIIENKLSAHACDIMTRFEAKIRRNGEKLNPSEMMCQRRSTKCSVGITNWRINSKRFENESNLRALFDVWMKAREPVFAKFLSKRFETPVIRLWSSFKCFTAYTLVSMCCPLVTSKRFKISWERCELGNLFWVEATLNVNDECALSWDRSSWCYTTDSNKSPIISLVSI